MAQVPIEELLKQCGSVYRLVLLAAKRAKELADGAPALIESPSHKVTSVALEEILQGKVLYKPEAADEAAGAAKRHKAKKDDKKKRAA